MNGQDAEPVTQDWTHLGPDSTKPGFFVWRDAAGQMLAFRQRARVFGGLYQVRVSRDDDGTIMHGEPAYTGAHADDAVDIEIRALTTEARLRAKRLETNASRTATIDDALAPLLYMAASLASMQDRRALLEYVTQRVYGA